MSRFILSILLLSLFGCDYFFDEYIIEHTEVIKSVSDAHGFSIDFFMEQGDDFTQTSVTPNDMLLAQRLAWEEAGGGKKLDNLKSAMVYIPHDMSTWFHVLAVDNAEGAIALHTPSTKLAPFYIVIRSDVWRGQSDHIIAKVYIHELTHAVCDMVEDSAGDPGHVRVAYWAAGGFVDKVYAKWRNQTQH